MIHHIELEGWGRIKGVQFTWDSEAGTIVESDAAYVLDHLLDAQKRGYVITHPYPTYYDIKDPLHDMAELALVLSSMCLHLTSELSNASATLIRPSDIKGGLQPDGSYILF